MIASSPTAPRRCRGRLLAVRLPPGSDSRCQPRRPWPSVGQFPAGTETIYAYDEVAGVIRWLYWLADVDVVQAPVRDDVANRIIWMGDGAPKQINSTILQAGAGLVGTGPWSGAGLAARSLGVQAPTQTPSVAAGVATDPTTVTVYDTYVYTYVTDLDEEGPPSPASATVSRVFNVDGTLQPVTVSDLAVSPGGIGFYTRKRIYRSAVGTAATSFQFLAEIPIAQTQYVDTKLASDLGSGLVSQDWDPPDPELRGLIALPNGSCAAFKGRELHFSEPYQPHAWPADYVQVLEEDIVGLGAYGTTVVIGTTASPYLSSGTAPGFSTPQRMELDQACIAKRSFSRVGEQGVAFASPDGIVLVGRPGASFSRARRGIARHGGPCLPRTFAAPTTMRRMSASLSGRTGRALPSRASSRGRHAHGRRAGRAPGQGAGYDICCFARGPPREGMARAGHGRRADHALAQPAACRAQAHLLRRASHRRSLPGDAAVLRRWGGAAGLHRHQ